MGSISSAIIACRLMGFGDPRSQGSGNPGATNVLRLFGKKAAIITLGGDLLKGLLPLIIARALGIPIEVMAMMGVAAFLGHLFPVFFNFRGGKGVATFIGVLYGLCWPAGILFMLIWSLMAWLFRYSSLSALTAAACSPLVIYFFLPSQNVVGATILMVSLMFWRHRSNIRNLLSGQEDKIGEKDEEPARTESDRA
jgi:glycerol-3-phosphate acyltransferase PlsY